MTTFLDTYCQPGTDYCNHCEPNMVHRGGALLSCTDCRSAAYCSRACQKKNWRVHKPVCQAIVKLNGERGEFIEPTADALQPLGEGACARFPAMMAARGISPCTNVVYVVANPSSCYGIAVQNIKSENCDSEHCIAHAIPGFKFEHARDVDVLIGYLHTADEVARNRHLHVDVRSMVAALFALRVPDTRILIRCRRDGSVSVTAGTVRLKWPTVHRLKANPSGGLPASSWDSLRELARAHEAAGTPGPLLVSTSN